MPRLGARDPLSVGFFGDPRRILVTDLDSDFRVHPSYFAYLSWVHLTDANRDTQLYQPIPYLHNNIWQAPVLQRLFAAGLRLQVLKRGLTDTEAHAVTAIAFQLDQAATDLREVIIDLTSVADGPSGGR